MLKKNDILRMRAEEILELNINEKGLFRFMTNKPERKEQAKHKLRNTKVVGKGTALHGSSDFLASSFDTKNKQE